VAVVIRDLSTPDLLLIKRAAHPGDPWSGHMALPGGRMEDHDGHLLATAVRETREETGVALWDTSEFMGHLPTTAPNSPVIPPVSVLPHVFVSRDGVEASAHSYEVDAVHWVPIHELRDPRLRSHVDFAMPGGVRSFPCFRVQGEVVWGLTYRILTDLLAQLS
jgi:8-oxo-dGTP pyrophosphatase MutT (NUDIX family)